MADKSRNFAVEVTDRRAGETSGAVSGPHTYREASKAARACGGRVVPLPGAQRPSGYRGSHRAS